MDAWEAADHAMRLLREGQLAFEHAAFMRATYCEALLASGRTADARAAIQEAHGWLSGCAAKLEDPALRESFLTNVPEHARILGLAREHGISPTDLAEIVSVDAGRPR
jgi:hypothetical protein